MVRAETDILTWSLLELALFRGATGGGIAKRILPGALQMLFPAPELDDSASIALGWAAFGQAFNLMKCLALFGGFEPGHFAGLGFLKESLCHRGRAAHFAQLQNFDLKFAA